MFGIRKPATECRPLATKAQGECHVGTEDWRDASINQGTPEATRSRVEDLVQVLPSGFRGSVAS